MSLAIPPLMPENTGRPMAPSARYSTMAAMHSFGESITMAKVMANICSVKGTGPSGTVTQADTAMMATAKPTNAIERVRDAALAPFLTCSTCCTSFGSDDNNVETLPVNFELRGSNAEFHKKASLRRACCPAHPSPGPRRHAAPAPWHSSRQRATCSPRNARKTPNTSR